VLLKFLYNSVRVSNAALSFFFNLSQLFILTIQLIFQLRNASLTIDSLLSERQNCRHRRLINS